MSIRTKTIEEIKERPEQKAGKPPYYGVFLLNDDYTTMDFVVYILERIFGKPPVEAARIMLNVHKKGKGLAGIYAKDIAETKVDAVHRIAREHEFPLRCVMEKANI